MSSITNFFKGKIYTANILITDNYDNVHETQIQFAYQPI